MPCPICFVPKDQLADISKSWPLRTVAQMQRIIKDGQTLYINKSDREKHLSKYGIRDADVSPIDYSIY